MVVTSRIVPDKPLTVCEACLVREACVGYSRHLLPTTSSAFYPALRMSIQRPLFCSLNMCHHFGACCLPQRYGGLGQRWVVQPNGRRGLRLERPRVFSDLAIEKTPSKLPPGVRARFPWLLRELLLCPVAATAALFCFRERAG